MYAHVGTEIQCLNYMYWDMAIHLDRSCKAV